MRKNVTVLSCALALLATLLVFVGSPGAQEKQPAETPAAAKPARAKPRGRLPNFYRLVVTPDQREQIYKLQSSYAVEIESLESQIVELEAKRDGEIRALLSPEQLEKLKSLEAEAKKRREAAAAKRAAAGENAASEEAAK
ncbi:MAG: hypothetical protein RIC55_16095 [Pirellulaceae bacterium]